MRLFFAIELPENMRKHLVEVQKKLSAVLDKVAMTRPQNLHVTMKFLGEVDERKVAALCGSIGRVTGGPIELTAEKLECFPPRGPIRIIAANLGASTNALSGIHAAIEQRCHFLGFAKENRVYHPHVTLARARRPLRTEFRERAEAATRELWPGPTFAVDEFVLMESRLNSEGAQYVVAARFPIVR